MVKKHRVTFDSDKEDAFLVHTKQNGIIKFQANAQGLYAYEVPDNYLKSLNIRQLSKELIRITMALHNSNLQRLDRMTMAHSLEGREP